MHFQAWLWTARLAVSFPARTTLPDGRRIICRRSGLLGGRGTLAVGGLGPALLIPGEDALDALVAAVAGAGRRWAAF